MTYEEIKARYEARYLTDKQLDGTGTADGDIEKTENCVSVGWITQTQADAIRSGTSPVDPYSEDMRQAIQIYEGVVE